MMSGAVLGVACGIVEDRPERIVHREPVLVAHPVAVAPDDLGRVAGGGDLVEDRAVAERVPVHQIGHRHPWGVGRAERDLDEQRPVPLAGAQEPVERREGELIGHRDPVERQPTIAEVRRGEDGVEAHQLGLGPGERDLRHDGGGAETGPLGNVEQAAPTARQRRAMAHLVVDVEAVREGGVRQPALPAPRRRRDEARSHGEAEAAEPRLGHPDRAEMRLGEERRVEARPAVALDEDDHHVAVDERQEALAPH
jgi:hypothetical protein